jgi:pimeloyl-ACP methyl ester carboxylesterase
VLALIEKVSHGVLRTSGAKSVWLTTDAGRIHVYELEGRGFGTFVLLHGMGATATAYTLLARRLRPHARRVLLVDLPGHGRSSEPPGGLDVAGLGAGLRQALDRLLAPHERAVVLGNSLGGAAALRYALSSPERVGALVLTSPAGAPLTDEEQAALRRTFALRTRADARRFLEGLVHAPPWYFRALEASLVEQLGRPFIQTFLATVRPDDFFSEEELGALRAPVTLLWGRSDGILPRSVLEFYRRALPSTARLEELDAVGHSLHMERPGVLLWHLLEARDRSRRVSADRGSASRPSSPDTPVAAR